MHKVLGIHNLGFWLLGLLLMACNEDPLPRPRGYFRIETPPASYVPYSLPCGGQFEVPAHAKIELINADGANASCWFNLSFPAFSAKLHCTLIRLRDPADFISLVDDSHRMVFSHEAKASGIQTHSFDLPENQVSGLVFDLGGPVASPLQFFATDSTDHFLRGSLYFQHVPNPDSIGPALDYVRQDIVHMIETLQWK
ncbi:MAG: gliding motility lipoprotein GldD [Bacteroidetes bacterium]|jgi:gliding motility-associated lipoprotein GldD|nr:gliding motility lipoprotein GldD [Bacteroidota bacterium]